VGDVAGCGGSSATSATPAQTTTATPARTTTAAVATNATQPAASGTAPAGSEAPATTPGQRAVTAADGTQTLKSGPVTVKASVTKVLDPVAAYVDTPRKGNKFVGVMLHSQAKGRYEAIDTRATASLQTSAGQIDSVRVIADGDCAGSYFPADFLGSPDETGCVAFEVPKHAKPIALTLAVTTAGKGGQQATFKLPAAS